MFCDTLESDYLCRRRLGMFKKYIGDRSFYKKVLIVAVPIIIQNAVTNFVGLLDNIMVGQVGTDQMNGVAIVNQLLFVFNLCIWGAVSGAGIFSVQYFGKGDNKGVRNTFRAKLILLGIVLIAGLLLFGFFGEDLISKFLHETDGIGSAAVTLNEGLHYLWIMMVGLLPFAVTSAYSNTLRDIGQTMVPMKAGVTAVFVNVILNYILIFGKFGAPEMGVQGAAIATVISRFLEASIVVGWVHTHSDQAEFIVGAYKSLRIPMTLMKQILIKGAPLAINEALWALGITMLNQCYSNRGLAVVGALNIASTISNLFNVVFLALGESVSIIIGQYLGAGDMEKAKDEDRKLIAFSVMCSVVIGFLMAMCRKVFPQFYNTQEEVKSLAASFILVTSIMMPFFALLHASYFTLRTGGKTIITFLFDSVFVWVIAVPIAFVLTHFTSMPILPLYIAVTCADFIKCTIGVILVKKGVWLQNIVNEIS